MLICLVTGLVSGASARDAVPAPPVLPGNPYTSIVERNLFGLKPPSAITGPEKPPPPLPKIIVDGINSILGRRQVLMKITQPPNQVASYVLSEGERVDEIEVLEINEKAASVKFKNHGTEQVIRISTNAAPASTPPGLPRPGVPPPMVGGGAPLPQITTTIPRRSMRPSSALPTTLPPAISPQPTAETPQLAAPQTVAPPAPPAPVQEIDPGMQTIMMELERERLKGQGDPIHMLIPPTELTPQESMPPMVQQPELTPQ